MASPGPAEAVTPTPAMSAWNPNTSDARTAVESAAYGIFNGCSINGQGRNRTAGTRIFSPSADTCGTKTYGASWGSACPDCSELDPELARIVEAWGELPQHIKAAMHSLLVAGGFNLKAGE
jgi:hypothetical protein